MTFARRVGWWVQKFCFKIRMDVDVKKGGGRSGHISDDAPNDFLAFLYYN